MTKSITYRPLILLSAGFAKARFIERIVTDRPGQTESVSNVIRGCMQLDVSSGFGITDKSPDYFLGLGISIKIPE